MDDFLILSVGRQIVELCAQREQLAQALQQAQSKLKELEDKVAAATPDTPGA